MAEYFMPGEEDHFIKNLFTWVKTGKRFRPSFPRAVEFQTLSSCNAKCVFCPHCHSPEDLPKGRMEDSLIRKIITECGNSLVGRVSPYLTNEPLLDKRMPEILKSIHKSRILPIKTKINTNAGLLTEETGRKLIESGLDQLWISVNGYSPESYKESMGLDFESTMANIETFLSIKKDYKKTPKIVITTLKTKIVENELEQAKLFWKERDVDFRIHHLDNRAGEEVAGSIRPESAEFKRKKNCDLFLKQAYIVENGDMIICCHDWKQSVVVGNVARTSISEVWNSKHFKSLIYDYYADNFDRIELCRNCG